MASFEFTVLGQTYVANKELSEKQIKEFEEIRRKESSTTTATTTTTATRTSTGTTTTYARTGRA